MARHFFRCTDCLAVMAVDDPSFEYGRITAATCGACDSTTFDHMGRVHMDRLITEQTACACDDRCTCARGPICTCSCGGKNHGKGLACTVTITKDRGAVPTLTPMNGRASLRAKAEDYRGRLAMLITEIRALLDRKDRARLPDADYTRLTQLQRLNRKIRDQRVHASRIKSFEAAGFRSQAQPIEMEHRADPIGPMATTQQGLF